MGVPFFWSCLVPLWCFVDVKFQVDWMGWVYRKLLRHTQRYPHQISRSRIVAHLLLTGQVRAGAQPQPIASNLQASFRRKMGMFCSALSTSWIDIPPTSLPLSIDFGTTLHSMLLDIQFQEFLQVMILGGIIPVSEWQKTMVIVSTLRIGLWEPFEMAAFWLINGGDPSHFRSTTWFLEGRGVQGKGVTWEPFRIFRESLGKIRGITTPS